LSSSSTAGVTTARASDTGSTPTSRRGWRPRACASCGPTGNRSPGARPRPPTGCDEHSTDSRSRAQETGYQAQRNAYCAVHT
jgi:hypothetical protein